MALTDTTHIERSQLIKAESESRNYYERYEISRCRNQNLEITTKSEILRWTNHTNPETLSPTNSPHETFSKILAVLGLSKILANLEGSEQIFPRKSVVGCPWQQDSQYWWNIFLSRSSQMNTTFYQNRPEETENWANLHLEPYNPITSLWNFCRWVADVPPRETFPAARSEEKWLFSQASHSSNHCSEFRLPN